MAIIALLLAIANIVNVHLLQKREIAVCTVDLWDISASVSYSLSKKSLPAEKAQSGINGIMTQIQNSLQSPSKYGCDIIAVKGSVFGSQVKDITAMLKTECSRAIPER